MRFYNTISAEEFTTESIQMKMRWLARQLRNTDKAEEIQQWVKVVTSLKDLLKDLRADMDSCLVGPKVQRCTSTNTNKHYTISPPRTVEWAIGEISMSRPLEMETDVDVVDNEDAQRNTQEVEEIDNEVAWKNTENPQPLPPRVEVNEITDEGWNDFEAKGDETEVKLKWWKATKKRLLELHAAGSVRDKDYSVKSHFSQILHQVEKDLKTRMKGLLQEERRFLRSYLWKEYGSLWVALQI